MNSLNRLYTLALYDPKAPTKISADASSYGLGAVLLQQVEGTWKPIAYASRTMNETERRYAQIEKEALATTWACEKFSSFIIGNHILIETDHKPLVPLLGTKHLDSLPPRVLRFRLHLDRFSYDIHHVPGNQLYTADTLSRAPLTAHTCSIQQELAELCIINTINHLPAGPTTLELYKTTQSSDPICTILLQYCCNGWPNKKDVDPALKPYWEAQGEITIGDGLLLRGNRIIVPQALQQETLRKLHTGHQGIVRCRQRASSSVWWPGLTKQLAEYVSKCQICARTHIPNRERLISSSLPEYPWQKAAADLFHLNGSNYLIIVDYFSRYPEVTKLQSTTSQTIINSLKSTFARHGIPEILRSDNGPQFTSTEFKDFVKEYQFTHTTSSPYYPASNGQVERMVKTVKSLLKDADDPYLALLSYRATPLPWCGKSPAQLSMGRNIRSTLPQTTRAFVPEWSYLPEFRQSNKVHKESQKENYDSRHRVRDLPEIPNNTAVFINTGGNVTSGRTVSMTDTPRSYIVDTPSGQIRRNRSHININPNNTESDHNSTEQRSPIMTRSRSGANIHPPERLV